MKDFLEIGTKLFVFMIFAWTSFVLLALVGLHVYIAFILSSIIGIVMQRKYMNL